MNGRSSSSSLLPGASSAFNPAQLAGHRSMRWAKAVGFGRLAGRLCRGVTGFASSSSERTPRRLWTSRPSSTAVIGTQASCTARPALWGTVSTLRFSRAKAVNPSVRTADSRTRSTTPLGSREGSSSCPCGASRSCCSTGCGRVDCGRCGVVTERVPWADGKNRTCKVYRTFLARWAKRLSWTEVAEIFQTNWGVVHRAVKWVVDYGLTNRALEGIESIGVDEIAVWKGHKYLTVVYQIDNGTRRLLWVARERTEESLRGFLRPAGPVPHRRVALRRQRYVEALPEGHCRTRGTGRSTSSTVSISRRSLARPLTR